MLTLKPVKLMLVTVLIIGFCPVLGWAGPSLLTDDDMDAVYAKGIFVNFEINIALPGGNTLSVPSINIPNISLPGNVGGFSKGVESVTVANPTAAATSTPTAATSTPVAAASTPVAATSTQVAATPASSSGNAVPAGNRYSYPGSGIFVTDNAMQGNRGMIINAPNSAVSMTINVVVLNNSTVGGDLSQSSISYPTNLFLSFKSYMQ